ncbi:MAG TPA: hypothetical protein VMB24_01845 [Dehalococcoidales bacterium]|nr:hypothetical protein [Dehalococcoidales bacterium]
MNISINEMTTEELNQLTRKENWNIASTISLLSQWNEPQTPATGKDEPRIIASTGFTDRINIDLMGKTQYPYN